MIPRVLITGPSGMGKTTLAKRLAKEYNVDFINVSIMNEVCKCYGIGTHDELIEFSKKNPIEGAKIQTELLAMRKILFGESYVKGFITDRGHIDSLVYTKTQVYPYYDDGGKFWEFMVKKAISIQSLFTHIIFIPYKDGWKIENDGVRIVDEKYQSIISEVYSDIIGLLMIKNNIKHLVLESDNFDERVMICKTFIV